ncbi:MAG: GlgB N-terminal domain-containing protein, partial [Gaiellaceae bacterium]
MRASADPHSLLGAHPADGGVVVRAYRPDALRVRVLPEEGEAVELAQADEAGLFEGVVEGAKPGLR